MAVTGSESVEGSTIVTVSPSGSGRGCNFTDTGACNYQEKVVV